MEVTEELKNAVLNCSGEEVLGWCQAFKRALINGEVFHSKSYGRVFRRNSYTVTYEDNHDKRACGQIQLFVKHTPVCQNACVGFCKCNREQYFAVVVKLQPQQDFQLFKNAGLERMQEHLQAMQRPRYMPFIYGVNVMSK